MLRKFLAISFVLSLLGAANSANAADLPVEPFYKAAPPAPVFNWTGFYIGAHVGWGFGDYTQFSVSGTGVGVDVDGVIGGVFAGYNLQFGRFVAGIEADYQNGPKGITPQGSAGPFWACGTGDCNVNIRSFGTVRGRLGYAWDRSLFYITGGYAFADIEGGIRNSAQQGNSSAHGYVVGLGVDYALSYHWVLKAEYLYVDLGDLEFGTGVGTDRFMGAGDFSLVKLAASYKF